MINNSIQITDSAAQQITEIINNENANANGIRVGVRGGGCSGLTYELDLEKEKQEGDRIFKGPHNIRLYVDKKSYLFLVGTIRS